MSPRKVLITGVYGLIGNVVYARLKKNPQAYDVYGSSRRRRPSARIPERQLHEVPKAKFRLADLSDFGAVQRAVEGMRTVVHLAADPREEAGWESVLTNNICGTYHVLEACRLAGVQRVIYASSVQVSFGYLTQEPYQAIIEGRYGDLPDEIPIVTHEWPTRPPNLYAGSKVCGEALAHIYAHTHGMSCLCLRIGWVVAKDRTPEAWGTSIWCSQRDIAQLVQRCIDAPDDVRFDIFYGVSDNPYRWLDVKHAHEVVGYVPQDRAQDDRWQQP